METKKYLDSLGLVQVWNKIKATFATKEVVDNKVDKVEGKGLSTNDLTDELVTTIGNKVDKVEGKGLSTNDLTNELVTKIMNAGDSTFSGNYEDLVGAPDLTNYVTAEALATTIAETGHIKFEFVESLPTTGVANTIYFAKGTEADQNVYDEFIWTGTGYEKVGSRDIDLTNCWKKDELVAATTEEINALLG